MTPKLVPGGWSPNKPIIAYSAAKEDGGFVITLHLTSAEDARSFLSWAMDLPTMLDEPDAATTGDAR